jgi:hypothetical protein
VREIGSGAAFRVDMGFEGRWFTWTATVWREAYRGAHGQFLGYLAEELA